MFGTDFCGNKRFYVKGTEEDAKRFTVDLAWYHSAVADFGSINRMNDDSVVINLIVKPETYRDDEFTEKKLRDMAKKFNCVGFTSFEEIKEH